MATRLNRYIDSVSAFDNVEIGLISFSSNPIRDTRGDVEELMKSIKEHGLLEPIIVRPNGNRFEVIAGNRRLRACKLLKHRKVKCIVTDFDDATCYEVSLVENVQRKTLDPLEEANAFRKYCERFGWGSQTDLARKIGKSQEYVSHRMKLLELPGEARKALRAGKISPTGAQELVWIRGKQSQSAALKMLQGEHAGTKSVRRLGRSMNQADAEGEGIPEYAKPEGDGGNHAIKLLTESILILRISLVRLDGIIMKAKDAQIKEALLSKRYVLHRLVDELIQIKNGDLGSLYRAPQLIK